MSPQQDLTGGAWLRAQGPLVTCALQQGPRASAALPSDKPRQMSCSPWERAETRSLRGGPGPDRLLQLRALCLSRPGGEGRDLELGEAGSDPRGVRDLGGREGPGHRLHKRTHCRCANPAESRPPDSRSGSPLSGLEESHGAGLVTGRAQSTGHWGHLRTDPAGTLPPSHCHLHNSILRKLGMTSPILW